MGKIDTSGWKEFQIGDLFEACLSKDDIQPKDFVEGKIPLVSSGKENNGIIAFVEDEKARLWDKNTLTIDMFGKVFYQESPYFAVSHGRVNILLPKISMTKGCLQFIGCAIEKVASQKYAFNEMCTGTKVLKDNIKLPATPDGAPDWAYMESYMANLEIKVVESLTLLQTAKDAEKKKVDTREWGEFHLYDIFSISMGNKFDRSKMCEVDEGINFVGRSALTNGVACAVTSVEDKKGNTVQPYPAGDITIALGGSIGAAFVQDKEFYTSQNVCVLHTDNPSITERVKWFVAASITASCGNYEAFTDELNRHIRTDFIIRLPMDKTGQPDWAYMEEYMRKVEEKAKNVLNHFEKDRNGV
jgi:hypothetical protein